LYRGPGRELTQGWADCIDMPTAFTQHKGVP
jgi:hypothetical protein